MAQTTIKVPVDLRQRVQEHAHRAHLSQAAVLEHALDLLDREAFFDQLRRDLAEHPETSQEHDEREAWLAGSLIDDGDDQ